MPLSTPFWTTGLPRVPTPRERVAAQLQARMNKPQGSTVGSLKVTQILEIINAAPELRFTENDQSDPAGRYRILDSGDALYFQRAASAAWASATDILRLNPEASDYLVYSDITRTNPSGTLRWHQLTAKGVRTAAGAGVMDALTVSGIITAANTANWTAALGVEVISGGFAIQSGAAGTVTGATIFRSTASVLAGTLTTLYHYYAANKTGVGTLTNQYGLYIEDMTGGATLNRAIYVAGGISEFLGAIRISAGGIDHDAGNIGFFAATPVAQQTGIVDADGTLADITTKFNNLLARMEAYGLLAVA